MTEVKNFEFFSEILNASESPTFAFVFKTTENEQVKIQDFQRVKKKVNRKIKICFLDKSF